jgi:hypothetical protein
MRNHPSLDEPVAVDLFVENVTLWLVGLQTLRYKTTTTLEPP